MEQPMVITPERLHARLAEYQQQAERTKHTLTALGQGILELEYWLSVVGQPEPPPAEEATLTPKQDV